MTKILVLLICIYCVARAWSSTPSPGVYFTPLGGAGTIKKITNMLPGVWPSCNVTDPCQSVPQAIPAAPLAPLNDEVSLQLRGPMDLRKIAIYSRQGASFNLVSYWEKGNPRATTNMAFLSLSGEWSVCHGNAMGYTTPYANASSSTPQILNGWLAEGLEITVLTSVPCNDDCGFYRGVGLHGWPGDKIFVVEASMPHSTTKNIPAIWSLNANIVRTAQYGCNCHASGCGEFDIAEVINENDDVDRCFLTLYSYNGNQGTQAYFPRPTNSYVAYLTHYSESDNRIYALALPQGCFPYGSTVPVTLIDQLQATAVDSATFPTHPNTNAVFNCSGSSSPSSTTAGSPSSTAGSASSGAASTASGSPTQSSSGSPSTPTSTTGDSPSSSSPHNLVDLPLLITAILFAFAVACAGGP